MKRCGAAAYCCSRLHPLTPPALNLHGGVFCNKLEQFTSMNNLPVAGVDIGGSHITAALVNMNEATLLQETCHRLPVDAHASATAIIEQWSNAIEQSFAQQHKPAFIGIAMPGPFDYAAGISLIRNQHKYDALYGLNVKELLAGKLGMPPDAIVFTNDAACFLCGEVFAGAAKNYSNVLGLTLGTGLGSALLQDGRAVDAELWCAPFKDGIAEDYLSGRWLTRRFHERTGETVPHVKAIATHTNKQAVTAVFEEFAGNLCAFLLPLLQEQQPEAIVFGGNIARASALFVPALRAQLQQHQLYPALLESTLGEHATLVGAASACLPQQVLSQ